MPLYYARELRSNTFSPARSHTVLKAVLRLPLSVSLDQVSEQIRARTGQKPLPAMALEDANGMHALTAGATVYELPARDPLQPFEDPHFVVTYALPAQRKELVDFLQSHGIAAAVAAGGRVSAAKPKSRRRSRRRRSATARKVRKPAHSHALSP